MVVKMKYSPVENEAYKEFLLNEREKVYKHHPDLIKNELANKRLLVILRCIHDRDAPRTEVNDSVYCNEVLQKDYGKWKWNYGRKGTLVKLFISCYRSERTKEYLLRFSHQPPGQYRWMRNAGVQWRFDPDKIVNKRKQWEYKNEKGEMCMQIIGLTEALLKPEQGYFKVPNKLMEAFEGNLSCMMIGVSRVEMDHRVGIQSALDQNIQPKSLTTEIVLDGSWVPHFQPLCNAANQKKREVCRNCRGDRGIDIPDGVCKKAYKQVWDGTCVGCWWHNSFIIQNVKEFPDLAKEMMKQWEEYKERAKKIGVELSAIKIRKRKSSL